MPRMDATSRRVVHELRHALQTALHRHALLASGYRWIVAASGGMDSTCLAHCVTPLARTHGVSLVLAHLHHGLRGAEADADARFVETLAESLAWPVTVERVDLAGRHYQEGGNLQQLARQVRYDFLARVAKETSAAAILTAHHADDQAETVLQNLLRGTGVHGLSGIPERSSWHGVPIVRPWLSVRRDVLAAYAEAEHVAYRTDASNTSPRYTRNRVRHELLPLLAQSYNPEVVEALQRLAVTSQAEDALLDQLARLAVTDLDAARDAHGERPSDCPIVWDRPRYAALHPALQRRVLVLAAGACSLDARVLRGAHIEAARTLLTGPRAQADVAWPRGLRVRRRYDRILIGPAPRAASGFAYQLNVPGTVEVPERLCRISADIVQPRAACGTDIARSVVLDAARLPSVLTVRSRLPGDRIQPQGFLAPTKLKDLFINRKVPREVRDQALIIAAGVQPVWVVGHVADARHVAGGKAAEVVTLHVKEL